VTPEQLSALVVAALTALVERGAVTLPDGVPAAVTVERPRNREHGDYATNVALQLGKRSSLGNPRELASLLADELAADEGIEKVDIAGPGFLNITVAAGAQGRVAADIVAAGEAYGSSSEFAGEKINLEFVSANPTGPIHIGGVRWAAVGDSLGRIFEMTGAQVTREYYFNDHGAQIDRFSRSLLAAALGEPTPEDGYAGSYIGDIAGRIVAEHPEVLTLPRDEAQELLRAVGVELMFAEIKQSRIYEPDGAVWLRTTDFGDDKDRVVIKRDGEPAYIAGDLAYYLDKRERGFNRVIIMLGADHHGYVGRLMAMCACFGDVPGVNLQILIGQLVNLVKDGEPVRMGKRTGNVITLEDLVGAVGVDAARYQLTRSSADSAIDIDLDLLVRATNDNPVHYVQYAHARTVNVMKNAAAVGMELDVFDPSLLTAETETVLLTSLGEFPRVVAQAAELREPHRVARYLEALAGEFHRWYDSCRVLPKGDEEITDLNRTRLWLDAATRTVLANGLALLGVSAPERK